MLPTPKPSISGNSPSRNYRGARLEDRARFELVAPRVSELDGSLPDDSREFADRASCPDAELPVPYETEGPRLDELTAENVLEVLHEAERRAIRTWSDIRDMSRGVDPRPYDMAQRVLREVIEHEVRSVEPLSKERDNEIDPAGHFARDEPGDAPYSTNRRFTDSAWAERLESVANGPRGRVSAVRSRQNASMTRPATAIRTYSLECYSVA